MLSLLLILIGHRLFLWLIALVAVTGDFGGFFSPGRHREVWQACLDRVGQTPEVMSLTNRVSLSALESARDPFLTLSSAVMKLTGLSPTAVVIVLSNIFLVLFLVELFRLLSRSVLPEAAFATAVLAILWPASFELGLGSRLAFECYLLTLTLRCLLDNRWLYVGLGYGGFLLYDHRGIWFLPLIVYFFLYFQRHFHLTVVLRRLLFFVLPFMAALHLSHFQLAEIFSQSQGSFLANLWPPSALYGLASTYGWPHLLGQFLSLGLLLGGAVLSFNSPLQWLYRSIPVSLGLFALAFIPWGTVGSRGVLAVAALQGFADNLDRRQRSVLEALLVFFGAVEVFRVFTVS